MSERDKRWEPYNRRDGWAQATRVHPDPDSPTGWICPECGGNASVFVGRGPEYRDNRYHPPDRRRCVACWRRDRER